MARIAHVDDHETVRIGFSSLLADQDDLDLIASHATVAQLVPIFGEIDLVVLDLRLSDGSTLVDNLELLVGAGVPVLALTGADNLVDLRVATRAGVLGVVRKTDSRDVIISAVRLAARGESIVTTEWAAAIDSDPQLPSAGLSPKEQQVLALYASGEKSVTVAHRTGLSTNTVSEYVRRIRTKYAIAGRPAHTKIDLYKRAVQDGILPSPE